MLKKLNWNETIFFFDVDDTLIDTFVNSIKASKSFSDVLTKVINKNKAILIENRIKTIFQLLAQGHWGASIENADHEKIIKRIATLQKPVIEEYGSIRKWSREVILKIAAEDYDVDLNPSLIYEAVDKYWEEISELSYPKEGVLDLFNEIKKHNRPIFLVTGSDARLKLNSSGFFVYNPKKSEEFKMRRMELLKSKGFVFDGVSIGDPEDKPHVDFFQKAITTAEKKLGFKIQNKNLVMFGDSYNADLRTPKEKLGFGMVVLYRNGQGKTIEESDKYISTGNLFSVIDYLK